MADNITTVNTGTGALPNTTIIATRDSGASGHWQQVDVGPASRTVVTGAQWALSVGTGAAVTLTVPGGSTHAIVSVDTGGSATAVRWKLDGTATSTQGHLLFAGESMEIDNPSSLSMIGIGGTATCQVSYHKWV